MECCKCISMKKAGRRSSMKIYFHGFGGLGRTPTSGKCILYVQMHCLPICKKRKERIKFMRDLEKVCIQPRYNYCTGEERFTFIKLPKCLVEDECFIELSMDAKLLYAFFLNRVSLSIKNGWIDDQGRVFIYYSIKNICEDLNCGTQKACKLLDELEKLGALERKRQGLGRPNKLYLKKMFWEIAIPEKSKYKRWRIHN